MKLTRITLVCMGLAAAPTIAAAPTVSAFLHIESSLNPAFSALKLLDQRDPPYHTSIAAAPRLSFERLSKRTQFHAMATPFMNGSNATLFPSPARADPTYGIGMSHAF